MDDSQHKLKVLERVAKALNHAGVTWAVGASLLLYFHEIVPTFNDIDLMILGEDAERAKAVMDSIGSFQPSQADARYNSKTFLEYAVDGVDVDVMAGFVIVSGGVEHDRALRPSEITECRLLHGERIPLQSLEAWRGNYALMGRMDKVALIDRALE